MALDSNTLSDLSRRVDRTRSGYYGTQEPTRAILDGQAALTDFNLSASDAFAVATELSGGDAWVSKQDCFISDAARNRMDGVGGARDGKISRNELAAGLQQGGLAVTRDGIFLSQEVANRYPASRPVPPAVIPPVLSRPVPPAVNPPIIDRPVPPAVYPPIVARPVPPAVGYTADLGQILGQYQQRDSDLKQIYNSSSMTQAEFNDRETQLVDDAVNQLLNGTRDQSYNARKSVLNTLYNSSPMTQADFNRYDEQLAQDSVNQLLNYTRNEPYAQRKSQLESLYNASPMTQAEYNQYDQELVSDAVNTLMADPYAPFAQKKSQLDSLYNGSSMTQDQYNQLQYQMVQQEVNRIVSTPESVNQKVDEINALYNNSSMTSQERDDAMRRIGY